MFAKIAIAISLASTVTLIALATNKSSQLRDTQASILVADSGLKAVERQLATVQSISGSGEGISPIPIDDAVLLAAKSWPSLAKNHFATISMINPQSKASAESAQFTNGVTNSPLGFKMLNINVTGTYKSIKELALMLNEITKSGVAVSSLTLSNNLYTATLEVYGN